MLADIHERLAGVIVEQLSYAAVIEQYDTPETLFYLDPPYWDCEGDYGADAFERGDFDKLADQLDQIGGQFVMSINATDGARETFARFDIAEVDTIYSVGSGGKSFKELIVSRFRARPALLV
jgi:DNA adenine methylase